MRLREWFKTLIGAKEQGAPAPDADEGSDDTEEVAKMDLETTERDSQGIWSCQTVRREAESKKLFTKHESGKTYDYRAAECAFQLDRLDHAGYKLAMGPECYISPADADKRRSVRTLDKGEAFFIPPGQFAFLLTEEVVRVPVDAFAFIALRSGAKFKGLLNVSGFHADPGFLGRLIFAVFNAGPGDVHLRRGEVLFMISFCDLDETTDNPRPNGAEVPDCKTQLHISTEIITPLSGQIQSLAGLKDKIEEVEDDLEERLHKMERDVAIMRWAFAIILGALVALLVRAYG